VSQVYDPIRRATPALKRWAVSNLVKIPVLMFISIVQFAAGGAEWPPRRVHAKATADSAVQLMSFDVVQRCFDRDRLVEIDASGSYPQLTPSARHRAINAALRKQVLSRLGDTSCTEPFKGTKAGLKTVNGEIFDECAPSFRSKEVMSVRCSVGWSGSAMGAHPDGQLETFNYRVEDGRELHTEEILRPDGMTALREIINTSLARDYEAEIKDADPEWRDQLVEHLLASPYLSQTGLVFEYEEHHSDFQVTLSFPDAQRFIQSWLLDGLPAAKLAN
jgi:hypothetical protein